MNKHDVEAGLIFGGISLIVILLVLFINSRVPENHRPRIGVPIVLICAALMIVLLVKPIIVSYFNSSSGANKAAIVAGSSDIVASLMAVTGGILFALRIIRRKQH